ncbi:MAG: lipid-A-disaccharide synthase N-terminal domain-containing protein [Phycisphaerales bacterium]|nr:lipid-A-disaccharide synthase N-terminal domain-containing protein [Phycisphaerales bacterium]
MMKTSTASTRAARAFFAALCLGCVFGMPVRADEEDLRGRIIALGREEVDDATFRGQVERLLGVKIEPTSLVERLAGTLSNPWVIFGFAAQGVFMMRFVVQWIASERRKRSYVPVAFWWLSIAGGLSLLAYAFHRRDPVFLFGQALGCVIYVRNLLLIYKRVGAHREAVEARDARLAANGAPPGASSGRAEVPVEAAG